MNQRLLAISLLAGFAALLSGCETTQGDSPSLANNQGNQTGYQRIDPAPQSQSYGNETKDVFRASEHDQGAGPSMPNAKRISLRVGQVIEVYRSNIIPGGEREMAFYLPVEARSVVQLLVETRGINKNYLLKAVRMGETVGGVVERRWLNSAGFDPDTIADEARIQQAVRASPYLISVTN